MLNLDFSGIESIFDDRETEAARIMPEPPHNNPHNKPPYGNNHNKPPHGNPYDNPYGNPHGNHNKPPHNPNPRPPYGFDNGGKPGHKPGGPPPHAIPTHAKSPSVYAVDPGAISGCLYKYTYVWLRNGRSYWFFPTYVGRKSVSGYRWSNFGWSYMGLDLDLIDFFTCAGH